MELIASEIPICPKGEKSCKQAFLGNSSEEPELLDGKLEVLDEGVKMQGSSLVG